MADNFLGAFNFIRMSAKPIGHKQSTSVESRSGVDGVFVWLNNNRGQPFEVTTIRDAVNIADANTILESYEAAIGNLLNVTFAGVQQPNQVCVLDVRPVPEQIKTVIYGLGGTLGNSLAIVTASWQLITTDIANDYPP